MSGKKAAARTDRRFTQALELYEKAMRAFGKKDYEKARDQFETLLTSFGDERDFVDRARTHLAICQRHLQKRVNFRPKTVEDLLGYGVYLHNRGEFEEALKYLRQAADLDPKNDHVLYCAAAAAARSGETEEAIASLKAAIAVAPWSRAQARGDSDFDPIREEDAFVSLVQGS